MERIMKGQAFDCHCFARFPIRHGSFPPQKLSDTQETVALHGIDALTLLANEH